VLNIAEIRNITPQTLDPRSLNIISTSIISPYSCNQSNNKPKSQWCIADLTHKRTLVLAPAIVWDRMQPIPDSRVLVSAQPCSKAAIVVSLENLTSSTTPAAHNTLQCHKHGNMHRILLVRFGLVVPEISMPIDEQNRQTDSSYQRQSYIILFLGQTMQYTRGCSSG